jgi:oligopeptide/dipeptide ABC transporter ATP-binding protein
MLLLYRGRIVERGKTADVIENPQHPYAKLLISSVPRPDPTNRWEPNFHLPEDLDVQ